MSLTPPATPGPARSRLARGITKPLAAGAGAALALTLLGAAPSLDHTSAPAAQSAPSDSVSVLETGAVRDDGRDDLAAFNAAVRVARSTGQQVWVPRGTFHLSGRLWLDGVTMKGAGLQRTTLVSTNTDAATIELTGDEPGLLRLRHYVPGASGRSPQPGSQNVRVRDARSFEVAGVHVEGAKGGGILVRGSHVGLIQNSIVEDTLADGIHMTEHSSDITVRGNTSRNTGDDGIAVVSYKSDGELTRGIRIEDNDVVQGHARGIAVVGGTGITIDGNRVTETQSGGIYIAAEKEWNTFGVENVFVHRNVVSGSPTRNSHASILVYSSEMLIDDVRFTQNTVRGATNVGYASWIHPTGTGAVGDLYYTANVLEDMDQSAWARTRLLHGTLHMSDNIGF